MRATMKARRASRSRTPWDTGSRSHSEVGMSGAAVHRIFTRASRRSTRTTSRRSRRRGDPGRARRGDRWLTGYDEPELPDLAEGTTFADFFAGAGLNPDAASSPDGLRGQVEDDRRPAHAADPLPRQAGRRAREGPANGEGAALGGFGRTENQPAAGPFVVTAAIRSAPCHGGSVTLTLIRAESGRRAPPAAVLMLLASLSLTGCDMVRSHASVTEGPCMRTRLDQARRPPSLFADPSVSRVVVAWDLRDGRRGATARRRYRHAGGPCRGRPDGRFRLPRARPRWIRNSHRSPVAGSSPGSVG